MGGKSAKVFQPIAKFNYATSCRWHTVALWNLNVSLVRLKTKVDLFKPISPIGYNEFDFFFKIKNTDPVMGAKLKSKIHLLNTFFDFLSRFLRVWLQSLKKVLIWPKNFFFWKNQKRCQKSTNMNIWTLKNFFWKNRKRGQKLRISRWFRIRWKSCEKMHQKKVISKTSLTNMSKSEKSAFFRHVFANNFFLVNFFKMFSTDSKSAWNSEFLTPFSIFSKKYF